MSNSPSENPELQEAKIITSMIFNLPCDPRGPVNRLQFMGGDYPNHEHSQGGINRDGLTLQIALCLQAIRQDHTQTLLERMNKLEQDNHALRAQIEASNKQEPVGYWLHGILSSGADIDYVTRNFDDLEEFTRGYDCTKNCCIEKLYLGPQAPVNAIPEWHPQIKPN